jgi:hypothetical protein
MRLETVISLLWLLTSMCWFYNAYESSQLPIEKGGGIPEFAQLAIIAWRRLIATDIAIALLALLTSVIWFFRKDSQ